MKKSVLSIAILGVMTTTVGCSISITDRGETRSAGMSTPVTPTPVTPTPVTPTPVTPTPVTPTPVTPTPVTPTPVTPKPVTPTPTPVTPTPTTPKPTPTPVTPTPVTPKPTPTPTPATPKPTPATPVPMPVVVTPPPALTPTPVTPKPTPTPVTPTPVTPKPVTPSPTPVTPTPVTPTPVTPIPVTPPPVKTAFATSFVMPVSDKRDLRIARVIRPTGNAAAEINKVLENTNKLRAEVGVPPLQYDENLSAYAQVRAAELIGSFGHIRPNGKGVLDYVEGDWGAAGENVAAGSATADLVVLSAWRGSPGHYENMISPKFNRLGIGFVYDPNSPAKYYWVQVFGAGNRTSPFEFVDGGKDNAKPFEQVVINGTAVPISLNKLGEWQTINTNQGWVNGYDNSRFGAVTQNGQTHLFYQGNQTDDIAMPKAGVATYQGQGLIIQNGQTSTNVVSQFSADFGKRTLNGTLSQNGAVVYDLSADINGNSFTSNKDATVQTQGAFFGDNGEELNGVFQDTQKDTKGVFGAKKK